jgi:hypothetical protein
MRDLMSRIVMDLEDYCNRKPAARITMLRLKAFARVSWIRGGTKSWADLICPIAKVRMENSGGNVDGLRPRRL